MSDFYFPDIKKRNTNRFCKILSTASFIPEKFISNNDIIKENNLPFNSAIISKTLGVEKRHIADDSWDDSDILFESARQCLEDYPLDVNNLTRLIVNKYFGDNLLPMTASRLQGKLGITKAFHAFDIDGGISSFLYSVDLISKYINTGDDYILLSSGGIHTKFINQRNPRVGFLFGDASASVLFGQADEEHILASYLYTNHQYYELAFSHSIISAVHDDSISVEDFSFVFDNYQLGNWKLAEDFYCQATREVTQKLLKESGLTINDIDLTLITENNKKIRELSLECLGVTEDRSISLLKEYGNTMSAMLPMLLDYGFTNGIIEEGMILLLLSHGEGMSGGGLIYKV